MPNLWAKHWSTGEVAWIVVPLLVTIGLGCLWLGARLG